ncbi:DUF1256 domain-containing protein [Desulfotomaculum copahuensis]|uniref:Uncharacterized protein n=1 Tax=Desulfotomaculum copahuensis TaxID=1838280 RepID=A0A1B7LI41_9FIRM|nr:DUF1256 domain-containing protein [Desulfotomaculum copahuensis]OAT86083.1 hypothetical protein A6M21_03940 [Desulfotomaculum copahuensis]
MIPRYSKSVVLNMLVPGLGHFYMGHYATGLMLAAIYISLIIFTAELNLTLHHRYLLIFPGIFWLICFYDSYAQNNKNSFHAVLHVYYQDKLAPIKLSNYVKRFIPVKRDLKIYCIGTKNLPGDNFGPLVGTMLERKGHKNIYGTIAEPVDALKLPYVLGNCAIDDYIIIIDINIERSAKFDSMISIIPEGIHPGAAFGKTLPRVGNLSILFTIAQPNIFYKYPRTFISQVCSQKIYDAAGIVAQALDRVIAGKGESQIDAGA